uniref:Uncharacterized protein n=1 Tax=Nothoprocta perdicaria TaxID=30464 RepID=A0A8C6ZW44_NOTPE
HKGLRISFLARWACGALAWCGAAPGPAGFAERAGWREQAAHGKVSGQPDEPGAPAVPGQQVSWYLVCVGAETRVLMKSLLQTGLDIDLGSTCVHILYNTWFLLSAFFSYRPQYLRSWKRLDKYYPCCTRRM